MASTRIPLVLGLGGTFISLGCSGPQQLIPTVTCDTVSTVTAEYPAQVPMVVPTINGLGVLLGTVVDRGTGAALGGAVVRIRDNGRLIGQTRTDSAGGFVAKELKPGTYEVQVVRIGYDVVMDSIVVGRDKVDTVHYRLQYRSCP